MRLTRLHGETVTVMRPTITYDDAYDPVETWADETVDNVLFGRPTTEDVDATMRAFGVHVAYVLGIPKLYTASLRACKVVRDWLMRVVGHDLRVGFAHFSLDGRNAVISDPYTITGKDITFHYEVPDGVESYTVAGDPRPLPPDICPTPWNREAHVGWVDG